MNGGHPCWIEFGVIFVFLFSVFFDILQKVMKKPLGDID